HAVAPNLRKSHFDAALLADDAAIFHALVLAAQPLVILDRPEDPGAKQAVAFGLERPVIDRLRFLDLAIRPGVDPLGASDRDADLIEALRPADLPKDVHQLVHQRPLSRSVIMPATAGLKGCRRRTRNLAPQTVTRLDDLPSVVALLQLDIEPERAQFFDQHVEGFGDAGLEIIIAADDRLVDLG